MEQVGTARIEFRKATEGNGIGMEGNRRNQRRSRKRTESDQIRNCKGRLMYRKLTKKNRKKIKEQRRAKEKKTQKRNR
jgi:hypothetical protein